MSRITDQIIDRVLVRLRAREWSGQDEAVVDEMFATAIDELTSSALPIEESIPDYYITFPEDLPVPGRSL